MVRGSARSEAPWARGSGVKLPGHARRLVVGGHAHAEAQVGPQVGLGAHKLEHSSAISLLIRANPLALVRFPGLTSDLWPKSRVEPPEQTHSRAPFTNGPGRSREATSSPQHPTIPRLCPPLFPVHRTPRADSPRFPQGEKLHACPQRRASPRSKGECTSPDAVTSTAV